MFAYRHLFHAGNFADVFKHALLARLLLGLQRKPKSFCYVDTHAGIGRYDLAHAWAQKNAEFRDGVARLWDAASVPPLLEPYLAVVRAENPGGALRFYPGSPLIARRLLRADDRAVLSELNRTDYAALKAVFAHDRQVGVHLLDGLQTLRAHLPPRERRGLVLVDSSFDRAGEYARLAKALGEAHERFATGVLALWYPMMTAGAVQGFKRAVVATRVRRILECELEVHPPGWEASLRGAGVLVVNPPFGFEAEAREIAGWLAPVLRQTEGRGAVRWLVPE